MAGLWFAAFLYLLEDDHFDEVITTTNDHYDVEFFWFIIVKRISLFLGYGVYVWLYATNSKTPRVITQWVLAINVAEAALLAMVQFEFVIGLMLFALSPFSPQFFVRGSDRTLYGERGNVLQTERFNFLSVKWYMRCYLFILGVWHLTSVYFISLNTEVAISLTCFIPAMLNELTLDNFLNHFSVRTFSLFLLVAIVSSFQPNWPPKLPFGFPLIENVYLLNLVQLSLVGFLFFFAICNDRLRDASTNEKDVAEHTKAVGASSSGTPDSKVNVDGDAVQSVQV